MGGWVVGGGGHVWLLLRVLVLLFPLPGGMPHRCITTTPCPCPALTPPLMPPALL